jgi:DamX protein
LGAVLFFQDQINQWFLPVGSTPAEVATLPAVEPPVDPAEMKTPPAEGPETAEAFTAGTTTLTPLQKAQGVASEQTQPMVSKTQPVTLVPETEVLASLNDAHESPSLQDSLTPIQTDHQKISKRADQETDSVLTDLPMQPADTARMVEPEAVAPALEPTTETAPTVTSSSTVAEVTSPAVDPLEKADWIRERPGKHYTLQLLGVEHLPSLKDFVARHGLEDRAFYYTARRKGKPWYPLLWGVFLDKKSAIRASRQLPAEVQRDGYWIRQFSELQAELNQNQ